MTKILILGGNGFIGSNLASFFLQKGYELHLMLRSNASIWRIRHLMPQINTYTGEINDVASLVSLIDVVRPEIVINATGIVKGESINDQEGVITSNLTSTVNIVNSFIKSSADILINTGSAKEYGFSPSAINENYHGIPIGLYGVTRKAATEYSRFISMKYERKIINLRLFTPYGPFDSPNRLIPHCILSLIQKRTPDIKNMSGIRDFVYNEDVSSAYELVIRKMDRLENGTVINVGNGKAITVNHVVNELLKIDPQDFEMELTQSTLNAPSTDALYSDNRKLLSLGWKAKFNLYSGLSATVQWFRNNMQYYRELQ